MFSDFLNYAPNVFLYFFCFLSCSIAFAYVLKHFTHMDWLQCLVGSLALSQLLKLLSMVVSSALNALGSLYIYFYLGSLGLLLLACYLISNKQISFEFFLKVSSEIRKAVTKNPIILSLAFLLLGLFLFLLLLRAVYFFDNTYDVVNYGYSKIALLFQNNSIFYLSGLQDLRIDTSERNGELYFLHAFLFSGDLRLIGLAGVEVWICIFFGILFLLRQLEVEQTSAISLALFLSSAPVVFGLSGITKGDSWAIFNFTCATGFLVSGYKSPNFSAARFFFFIIFLALSPTSKMTIAFGVAPMFLYGAVIFLKKKGHQLSISWFAALFPCVLIAANKQVQNLFVYHNPFKRQQWETTVGGFKIENFFTAWSDFLPWLFGMQGDLAIWGWQSDMLKGMGHVFIVFSLVLGMVLLLRKKSLFNFKDISIYENLPFLIIFGIGSFCVMSYVPNKMGAFEKHWCRFLAPYFIVLACFCFAFILKVIKNNKVFYSLLLFAFLLAGFHHLAAALKTSSLLSHRGKKDMLQRILYYDRVASRFGLEFGPSHAAVSIYKKYDKKPLKILVYTLDFASPYSWTFGDNFVWKTTVTDNFDRFLELLHNQSFDYFCIVHYKNLHARDFEKPIASTLPNLELISHGDWANFYRIKKDS